MGILSSKVLLALIFTLVHHLLLAVVPFPSSLNFFFFYHLEFFPSLVRFSLPPILNRAELFFSSPEPNPTSFILQSFGTRAEASVPHSVKKLCRRLSPPFRVVLPSPPFGQPLSDHRFRKSILLCVPFSPTVFLSRHAKMESIPLQTAFAVLLHCFFGAGFTL